MVGVRVSPSFTCHSTLDHLALANLEFETHKAEQVETRRTCNPAGGRPRRKMEHLQGFP